MFELGRAAQQPMDGPFEYRVSAVTKTFHIEYCCLTPEGLKLLEATPRSVQIPTECFCLDSMLFTHEQALEIGIPLESTLFAWLHRVRTVTPEEPQAINDLTRIGLAFGMRPDALARAIHYMQRDRTQDPEL